MKYFIPYLLDGKKKAEEGGQAAAAIVIVNFRMKHASVRIKTTPVFN